MLEEEVVRRFLAGESLDKIRNATDAGQKEIIQILHSNQATSRLIREQGDKYLAGEYAPFFVKVQKGRPKLEENRRRKIRQIRISDDELAKMGHPTTSRMREDLLFLVKLTKFLSHLDDRGIKLLPESVLHEVFDPNDPFWGPSIYGKNLSVLREIVNKSRLWDEVAESMAANNSGFEK